jgi:hypothetical protein
MPRSPGELQGYGEGVATLLGQAAEVQRRDPATFLWQVRRALEALVRLIHLHHAGPVLDQRPGLETLIKGLPKSVSSDLRERLDWLRTATNHGVHIRELPLPDLKPRVDEVQPALKNLLEEALGDAALLALSPATREAIRASVQRIDEGGAPLEQIQRALRRTEGELALAQQNNAHLRQEVARLTGELAAGQGPPRAAWSILGLTGLSAGLFGAVSGGALVALGFVAYAQLTSGEATRPEPPQAHKELSLRSAALPAPTEVPANAPEEAAAAAACPAGLLYVPGQRLVLGQPDRPSWPKAVRAIPRTDEPGFCIDAEPVGAQAFEAWSGPRATQGCEAPPGEPSAPASCVDLAEAEGFCAARGATLPTLRQWEAFARSPHFVADRDRANKTKLLREWSSEAFPPAALERRPSPCLASECAHGMFRQYLPADRTPKAEGNVLYSWNQQAPEKRLIYLGFRCVAPVTER